MKQLMHNMKVFLTLCIFIFSLITTTGMMAGESSAQQTLQAIRQTSLTIDTLTQKSAGIETEIVKASRHHAEFIAYGKAISIQPIVALHHRYLLGLTECNRAVARFKQAEQTRKRQQQLFDDGVTAKRNLQEQQAQWQSDKAQLDAIQFQTQSLSEEVLLNWGKRLSEWTLSAHSEQLNNFISGRKTLLQIALPSNRQLPSGQLTIYVEPSGNRNKAQIAELISPAPQTDASNQGVSYFFQTDGKNIKAGMNISAWLPEQQQVLSGVIIPPSAVVWFMDQAYVYIKTDSEIFSRRAIKNYWTDVNGYFINDTIKPGEQIVTTGAQTLLSEELREQIPEED